MALWSSSTTRPTISRTIVKEETKGTGLQFNCYNALVILNPVISSGERKKRLAAYRKAGPKRCSSAALASPFDAGGCINPTHRSNGDKKARTRELQAHEAKRNEKKKRKEETKDQPD